MGLHLTQNSPAERRHAVKTALTIAALAGVLILLPDIALAADDMGPFEDIRKLFVAIAKGVKYAAFPLIIITIMILGFLTLKGRLDTGKAVWIAIGIFVIVSAASIGSFIVEKSGNRSNIDTANPL